MIAIFKREFGMFFHTAVGYIVIGLFWLFIHFTFFVQNIFLYPNSDTGYLFYLILLTMSFLSPLLTMRSFSEEYRQKTDVLLFTAPIRLADAVIGKFLACMCLYLTALSGTLLCFLTLAFFTKLQWSAIFCNYLTVILAGAVFIALGIFISSLTQHQLVSILAGLCVIAVCFMLSMNPFHPLIVQISPFLRFTDIQIGIFSFDSIFYYASVTCLFLFLTVYSLEKTRQAH